MAPSGKEEGIRCHLEDEKRDIRAANVIKALGDDLGFSRSLGSEEKGSSGKRGKESTKVPVLKNRYFT